MPGHQAARRQQAGVGGGHHDDRHASKAGSRRTCSTKAVSRRAAASSRRESPRQGWPAACARAPQHRSPRRRQRSQPRTGPRRPADVSSCFVVDHEDPLEWVESRGLKGSKRQIASRLLASLLTYPASHTAIRLVSASGGSHHAHDYTWGPPR